MSKKEVSELYTVRALACLTIVLLHSMEAVANIRTELEQGVWTAVAVLLKFGTPVFVMVSAFLLAYSYSQRTTPRGMFQTRAAKLLPPFILIGAFYGGLSWYTDDLAASETAAQFAENMFLAGYHGYFILIILQFFLIFDGYKRLSVRVGARPMILGSLLINAGWLAFFNFVPAPAGYWGDQIWHRVSWLPFPGWLFFFTVAYYLGANVEATRRFIRDKAWDIAAAALAAAMLVGSLFLTGLVPVDSSKRIDMLLLAPLAFAVFFMIGARRPNRVLLWVSANSFGIYLLHFFFIAVVGKVLSSSPIPFPSVVFAVVLFVASAALSGLATMALNRLPLGQFIVGPAGRLPAFDSRRLADG